jgi:DNA-binding NarL/FixJ family response regulator
MYEKQSAKQRSDKQARAKSPRRVMIVDDHPMMRQAIVNVLSDQTDLEVCGEAQDAASAVTVFKREMPDVVIVDLTLRNSHGLELIKQLRAQSATVKLLVYSMHEEKFYAERAIHAGANGYLNKGASADQVITALRSVLDSHMHLSAEAMTHMLRQRGACGRSDANTPIQMLSDRELEVFEHLGRGANTRQIAERMNVSTKTIDVYRQRIKAKLNVTDNNELVRIAVEASMHIGQ